MENNGIKNRKETILLVDDEDMIIEIGSRILEKLGYNVMCAKSGKEGIALYKVKKEEVNLVILDMVMPDMGGAEIFDVLKSVNKDIKILIASGYNMDDDGGELISKGCNGFIQKPFRMEEISRKIREILDS